MADSDLVLCAEAGCASWPREQGRRTVVFPARCDQLIAICTFVTSAARSAGLDSRAVDSVEIAVEEACANIIKHAYGGEGLGDIECTRVVEDSGLTVILRDYGRPFDPGNMPKPDLAASLEEREIGGWGLYFIRQLMDQVRFEFTPDLGNVLTLVKRKTGQGCHCPL